MSAPALDGRPPEDGPTRLQAVRSRGRVRGSVALLGPAFVAAIAYVDPGNFATNFSAGAGYGYQLIWVILAANLMAMLIQSLSGKVGLATGRNLPELCREHFRPWTTRGLWAQAEVVAMATDLAEIVGGAIALRLLFDVPLLAGGLITAAVAFALLSAAAPRLPAVRAGHRRPARRDPARLPVQRGALRRSTQVRSRPASCPASPAPTASCWRPASSARR